MSIFTFLFLDKKEKISFEWQRESIIITLNSVNEHSYIEDDSGIDFLIKKNNYSKIVIIISQQKIEVYCEENFDEPIGWIIIPIEGKKKKVLSDKNFLEEENILSLKLIENFKYNVNFEKYIFESKNYYLGISILNENNNFYECQVLLTKDKVTINSIKNRIFIQILEKKIDFSLENFSLQIIISNEKVLLCSILNLNFIKQGINFCQKFFVNKQSENIKIFLIGDDGENISTNIFKNLKISQYFNSDINFFSSKIYSGEKIILKTYNAELFLPSLCLKEEMVISIKSLFKTENTSDGLKLFNLIECFPDNLYFDRSVTLKMRSSVNNPKPYDKENDLIQFSNKLYEQKIRHFSKNGIIEYLNPENFPFTCYYFFKAIKDEGKLKMILTHSEISEPEVRKKSIKFCLTM